MWFITLFTILSNLNFISTSTKNDKSSVIIGIQCIIQFNFAHAYPKIVCEILQSFPKLILYFYIILVVDDTRKGWVKKNK